MVFTDQYDPTQEISFFRPFHFDLIRHGRGLVIIAHNDLARLFNGAGPSQRLALLERALGTSRIANVILSRYTGIYWADLVAFARRLSVPLTVFLDDNLLEVPEDIGAAAVEIYGHRNRREALLGTLAECDRVVASTKALEQQLASYPHRAITHLPIYCSVRDSELTSVDRAGGPIKVGYMASKWHIHDLDYVAAAIEEVLETHSNVNFEIYGFEWHAPFMARYGSRVQSHAPTQGSYMSFRNRLKSLKWDIGIAPLRPIQYNRCKANTKWVEYVCAGLAVVAAEYDPYADIAEGAVIRVEPGNIGDWVSQLNLLIEQDDARRALQSRGYNELRNGFNIQAHAVQTVQKFVDLA